MRNPAYVAGRLVRTGVPPTWEDMVPVYIHQGNREVRIAWLFAKQPQTNFSFVLPLKPDKMTINDEEDILANVQD